MNELFLAIFTVWVMVFVVFAMIGIPAVLILNLVAMFTDWLDR